MPKPSSLAAYLQTLGVVTRVVTGPFVPTDIGDRVVVVTRTGGPGTLLDEEVFDRFTFQVRVRGKQRNPDDAEAVAAEVDGALTRERFSYPPIDGQRVLRVNRTGGPPATYPRDSSGRDQYVCNYYITVAT